MPKAILRRHPPHIFLPTEEQEQECREAMGAAADAWLLERGLPRTHRFVDNAELDSFCDAMKNASVAYWRAVPNDEKDWLA